MKNGKSIQLNKQSGSGFTLVELMITVSILGILSVVALPNLMRARSNANDQAVKEDLKAFVQAVESYRTGQGIPVYPGAIADLTVAIPPYLDASWSADTVTRHGHVLTYLSGESEFSMTAQQITGQSLLSYCIDSSGVIYADATTTGNLCSGTAINS